MKFLLCFNLYGLKLSRTGLSVSGSCDLLPNLEYSLVHLNLWFRSFPRAPDLHIYKTTHMGVLQAFVHTTCSKRNLSSLIHHKPVGNYTTSSHSRSLRSHSGLHFLSNLPISILRYIYNDKIVACFHSPKIIKKSASLKGPSFFH